MRPNSKRYKSVTGPNTTVALLVELTLVRRARPFVSCSGSLGSDSGPFVVTNWRPLNFERSCVTKRSSLEHDLILSSHPKDRFILLPDDELKFMLHTDINC